MGSDRSGDLQAYGDERPQHKIYLDEYLVGKYPVTIAQFSAFVKATGFKMWGGDPKDKANHPVTFISWDDAVAFCEWASQVTGRKVLLPTEAQWEKAARGTDGRLYPWGNRAPDANLCNFNMNVKGTTPIGKFSPKGDSPYGCADMAGNVWEWCADWFDPSYYQKTPPRNPEGPNYGSARVLRGGAFNDFAMLVRCAYRNSLRGGSNIRTGDSGFRICALPSSATN